MLETEPKRVRRTPPGEAPLCECGCGQKVDYNWSDVKWRRWVMGHSPKPSIAQITTFYPPIEILRFVKKAYEWPMINDDDRLMHSAFVATSNVGIFRIGETLSLRKSAFKKMRSLENAEFLVAENVTVEKSGGKLRNVAFYLRDPLVIPLMAHLSALPDIAKLFDMSDQTGINIAKRVTGDSRATNHWFREQRNTWLATGFNKPERERMVGWAHADREMETRRRMNQRDMADRYEFLNWYWYADRLAKLTDRYWEANPVDNPTRAWLNNLLPTMGKEKPK